MTEESINSFTNRLLLAIFGISVVAICLGGYRFYAAQREAVELEVSNELQTIAELRAEQVFEWRRERLDDANAVTADPVFIRSLHSAASGEASPEDREILLRRLTSIRELFGYANAILIDAKGNEVLHQGQLFGPIHHFGKILSEISAGKIPVLRDLNSEGGGGFHFGLNIPLLLPGENVVFGMLSFALDPEEHLFPMVDRWPGPSRVGETWFVSHDGAQALYLGYREPKGKAGARPHFNLDRSEAAAIRALKGSSGLIRGNDLQGRKVIAAVCPIPNSEWLVITQTPLEFIDKPIRDRSFPIALAVVSLILAAGMTAAYLWRLEKRRHEAARHDAELERQALTNHYNFLSRSLNDAILLTDEEGRIVETNECAVTMYGYSRDELMGMNARNLRAPESASLFAEQWQAVRGQPASLLETVHARKDGSTFPVEIGVQAITVEGSNYYQAIIRDITQRNQAKRQLENANRLYAVLSQCNQALLHATGRKEMFDAVCGAAVKEGGFPLAMIVGVDLKTGVVLPESVAGTAKAYADGIEISARPGEYGQGATGIALRTGKPTVVDDFERDARQLPWRERATRAGLRSSVTVPIQRGGRVEFAFALYSREVAFFNDPEVRLIQEVADDISFALGRTDEESARKAAEEALRHSEERYRYLVESAPVGMYVHTGGIVRYMNAKGLEMLGYTSFDEMAGANINNFIHPGDRELVWERIRILAAGGPCPLLEERFLRADGSTLHVEVSAVPTVFEGEKSTFVFFIDVTQRKKAEKERASMEEQFLQAQKMESVGRLAGGVAHDFNNNLTVINGYCDLLLSSLAEDDPVRREIAQIRKAGDQASKLTRQLLTFSRRQVFSPERIDLNDLVTEAKSIFDRLIGDHVRIQTWLAPELPCVLADPTQIHQLLLNLVINARDAMPTGGDLIITTSKASLNEEQASRTIGARPGEFVVLTVSDSGIGMDAETKRHIFEPFFTTKPRGSGTGLGLATVYGIVQQSNGWVEVESAPDEGATFRILLPAVHGGVEVRDEPVTNGASRRETILLVEDRTDVRMLTLTILVGLGYTVLEADSGIKALEIFAAREGLINLLLTDVVMPGMTGPELAKRLRALRPSIKVLFISGYADDERFKGAGAEDGFEMLAKPFTPSALAAKVSEVLSR